MLALDYFLATFDRFGIGERAFLRWSVVGQLLAALVGRRWSMVRTCLRLLGRLVSGRNPYVAGRRGGQRLVEVEL